MQEMSPDMEDLMRKASEAYPLRQMDDRWDEIASKIPVAPPLAEGKNRGFGKYYAFTLLLFLFLFLGAFFFNKRGSYKPLVARPGSEKKAHKRNDANDELKSSVILSKTQENFTALPREKQNPQGVSYSNPSTLISVANMKNDPLNFNLHSLLL